ncbi:hypothetical protein [Atopococcus tabaci]|uniref:hypothetical protein n=1 Tax=Atopococcus tabaci TaxID=269774 RepID=UPI00055552BB|nr:hypothetical protein [Atopococcus tabaci]
MVKKANSHIRELIKEQGVYQWEVAEALGISEVTLIRWLRKPLEEEKEKEIIKSIDKAKKQKRIEG